MFERQALTLAGSVIRNLGGLYKDGTVHGHLGTPLIQLSDQRYIAFRYILYRTWSK